MIARLMRQLTLRDFSNLRVGFYTFILSKEETAPLGARKGRGGFTLKKYNRKPNPIFIDGPPMMAHN
jgi:hypothetical protein